MKSKKEIKQRIRNLRSEATAYEIKGLSASAKTFEKAAEELEWVLE